MRKLFIACVMGVAVLTGTAYAQPTLVRDTSKLAFDHDGSGPVTHFEVKTDAANWATLPAVNTPNTATWVADLPALTQGPHTLQVRACNFVCSDGSNIVSVVVTVKPNPPSQLRIVAQED